jgi:UDP-N-acetyl-D-galactosamine dehydrogenase
MAAFCAQEFVKRLIQNGAAIKGQTVIVFGLTFKENCPDIRNSKVADLVHELESFGLNVLVTDPHAESVESEHEYRIKITPQNQLPTNAIGAVLAVAHKEYTTASASELFSCLQKGAVIADIKAGLNVAEITKLGHSLWRL